MMITLMKSLKKYPNNIKLYFSLGNFNLNLSNYSIHAPTNEFLESLSSHYVLPNILQPIRETTNSKPLIDYIFSNVTLLNKNFRYLAGSLSDHHPQLQLAAPNNSPIAKISPDLVKIILFLIIFWLTDMIFSFH